MKFCSRCHIEKPESDFRVRVEKRSDPPFSYFNNTCRACDAEITRAAWAEKRKTPEGRKKNCESARKAYRKRREKVKAQMKKKRQTPDYKEKMREYRRKNKEKIFSQEVATKKRYQEKHKSQITDKYVIGKLREQGNLNPTEEEIEIKRAKILIHRIKEKIDSQKVGVSKVCSVCKEEYDLSQFWRTAKNSKKRVAFCKACGSEKNEQQKIKRHERYSKSAQPLV